MAGPTRAGGAEYVDATTALLLEADLLTTNVRRFPMIAGLKPAY